MKKRTQVQKFSIPLHKIFNPIVTDIMSFQIPYFLVQFPQKLFFFEFGNHCPQGQMSPYINVQTLFKGGNQSRAETICKGRNFHWAERQKKTKWSRLQWCPPCQNKTRISGGDKCIFNGTLFHISDIQVRIKRSIDLLNETSLILRKVDQRNQTMVSMHFLFADAKLQYFFSLLLLEKICPIFFHFCVLITVYVVLI